MAKAYIKNPTTNVLEELRVPLNVVENTTTSDVDKAYVDAELAKKVDKVSGKGLSTNDYTTDEKTKLSGLENYELTKVKVENVLKGDITTHNHATQLGVVLAEYVKKVTGKDLSSNDFTNALKTKLEGLSNYNDAAVQQAITDINTRIDTLIGTSATEAIDTFNEIEAFLQGITDTETLTGLLADLKSEITALIPTALANLTDDATHRVVTDTEKAAWDAKSNFSGSYNDLTDKPTNATMLADGLMSKDDKKKLEGIEEGAQKNPDVATTTTAGLMSAADKSKLDEITGGGQTVTVVDNLTTDSGNDALSARQGKLLNEKIGNMDAILDSINGEVI